MPTSVRLDKQTEQRLERLARLTGRTKSGLIRDAIMSLDESFQSNSGQSAYERLSRYVGVVRLGPGDRARRAEELLRAGFGRKKKP
ncbi:MAG: ribbon-helix-helix domain-containing protein [Gemmatimonadota bacterium]